jgi:hypothetical protein
MVPAFLASWLSESWIAWKLLDYYPRRALAQAVFEANLVTYGLLVIVLGTMVLREMLLIVSLRRSILKRRLSKATSHGNLIAPRPATSWPIGSGRVLPGIAWLKIKEDEIARHKLVDTSSDDQDDYELDHEKAA